jgi:hypothetical protein
MGRGRIAWWLLLPFLLVGVLTGRAAGVPVGQISMSEPPPSAAPDAKAKARALQIAATFLGELSPPVGPITFSLAATSNERVPGSCTTYPPAGQGWEGEADFVTEVAAQSLFGIPVRRFRVTCGGMAIE